MKKTVFCLILALCLTLGLAVPAFPEESPKGPVLESDGFRYRLLEDGTAEIVQYTGGGLELALPETLDGCPVTSIGEEAFYDSACSLRGIAIPASVRQIGSGAFAMTDLTEIEIPAGVIRMGENPFSYCASLETVTVAEGNPAFYVQDGVLFCREDRSLVCYPNLLADPEEDEFATYTVPAGTEIIRGNAFGGVECLSEIYLPDSLRVIGPQAFGFCESLHSITIPDSVAEIGDAAFDTCRYLGRVKLPAGLQRIPAMLFYECDSLYEIEIPGTVTEIGDSAFDFCGSLEQIRIPDGVTKIETAAFEGCYLLVSAELPDGLTEIGDFAFCSCSALQEIRIPAAVTRIGEHAFRGCGSLRELAIPDSVESIGEFAFDACGKDLVLLCGPDSAAKTYCEENGIAFRTE